MTPLYEPLTRQQITILRYVAQGHTAVSIARKMGIKYRTVVYHFDNAKRKLNAATLEEAMFIAGRDNLLGEYGPGEEV
jgi:LuxR family transcriptional regulator, activator of conjugal transfer of Ti plasmids